MSLDRFDIYMLGADGQGIGLLREILARAADHAGIRVCGVDTHGVAQCGDTVVSNLRLGPRAYTPLVDIGNADMVISMGRHEAVRGVSRYLRENGILVYYDAVWQPLDVRLGKGKEATPDDVEEACTMLYAKVHRVFDESLSDARMQCAAVLGCICRERLIRGIEAEHYEAALNDLLKAEVLARSLQVFAKALVG